MKSLGLSGFLVEDMFKVTMRKISFKDLCSDANIFDNVRTKNELKAMQEEQLKFEQLKELKNQIKIGTIINLSVKNNESSIYKNVTSILEELIKNVTLLNNLKHASHKAGLIYSNSPLTNYFESYNQLKNMLIEEFDENMMDQKYFLESLEEVNIEDSSGTDDIERLKVFLQIAHLPESSEEPQFLEMINHTPQTLLDILSEEKDYKTQDVKDFIPPKLLKNYDKFTDLPKNLPESIYSNLPCSARANYTTIDFKELNLILRHYGMSNAELQQLCNNILREIKTQPFLLCFLSSFESKKAKQLLTSLGNLKDLLQEKLNLDPQQHFIRDLYYKSVNNRLSNYRTIVELLLKLRKQVIDDSLKKKVVHELVQA
ncbi:hypothetical protein HELRODRAFT_175709 [Helobdella robusta]|uniref:Uncharacterized protein n=1 Tax=Helobdella robusta TaxID=6412 RepID=T1F9J9_HELRO|nr:hypothetical protein HELRODRAFT_175709 [Helobdella robusta]ESO00720.1 hypothetical protein HELRODRAFT_175709 [Helobdella robusta]